MQRGFGSTTPLSSEEHGEEQASMTSKLESKDTSRVAAHVHTVSAALPPPPPTESSVTTTEGAVASSGRAQNHASQSQKDYQQGTKHLSISMPDLQTWDDQTPKLSTSSAGAAGNEAQTEPPSTTSQSPTLVHRQGKEDSWLENEWDDAVVEAERGLYSTPKCHSFRHIFGLAITVILLEAAIVVVWLLLDDVRTFISKEIFIVILIVAFFVPVLITIFCVWEKSVPVSVFPRAYEVAPAEQDDDITGPIRNALNPSLVRLAGVREMDDDHYGITTLRMLWDANMTANASRPCLGIRLIDKQSHHHPLSEGVHDTFDQSKYSTDFILLSYQDVHDKIRAVGAGFHAKLNHIAAATRELDSRNIALFTSSKIEWMITCLSGMRYNMPIVTLNPFMSLTQMKGALQRTNAAIIVCDSVSYFSNLAQCLQSAARETGTPSGKRTSLYSSGINLHAVVYVGHEPNPSDLSVFDGAGVEVLSWEALVNLGMRNPVKDEYQAVKGYQRFGTTNKNSVFTVPVPSSLALICFHDQSNTDGETQMTCLTHQNIIASVGGSIKCLPPLHEYDRYLSCLPPFHLTELCMELAILFHGGSIGYSCYDILTAPYGSMRKPKNDISFALPLALRDSLSFRPTIINIPPLAMEQLRKALQQYTSTRRFPRSQCFSCGFKFKRKAFHNGVGSPLWDSILFDRLRTSALGGCVRLIFSSGGTLHALTQRTVSIALCCPVIQVYGKPCTGGVVSIQWPDDRQLHRAGPPCACTEIKIKKYGIYKSTTVYGEICVRGHNVTSYDDNVDESGWLATGDIGRINTDGTLTVIGRKQDFLTISGKLVCALRIENILLLHKMVKNAMVTKETGSERIVAIVSLENSCVPKGGCFSFAPKMEELEESLLQELRNLCSKSLEDGRLPVRLILTDEEWTVFNGMLDTSLRLNRAAIFHRYSERLEKIKEP